MGSKYEKMVVVPDTGSTWLIIEGYKCTTCLGNKYNYLDDFVTAPGGTLTQLSTVYETRSYGSASTKGYRVSDTVCL